MMQRYTCKWTNYDLIIVNCLFSIFGYKDIHEAEQVVTIRNIFWKNIPTLLRSGEVCSFIVRRLHLFF